jgi:hypothetical protein
VFKSIKKAAINLFTLFLEHDTSQKQLERVYSRNNINTKVITQAPNPYYQYEPIADKSSERNDLVFISSRFRSGSTLLWNLFRSLPNTTAYYEPFNERRWFDQEQLSTFVDNTHVGVSDYWAEYAGLEDLSAWYDEDWIRQDLFMTADSWKPKMKTYIAKLAAYATGRPFLQFNRIDFRLTWLTHNFPNAKLIHLYRNPREQWCSFLTDKQLMNAKDVQTTYKDSFYLNSWCDDLEKFFPFLSSLETPHPYQRFYYLWKLSFLHGQQNAHISIEYEKLVSNPEETWADISAVIGLSKNQAPNFASLIKPLAENKWPSYADKTWFLKHEMECEAVLSSFLY